MGVRPGLVFDGNGAMELGIRALVYYGDVAGRNPQAADQLPLRMFTDRNHLVRPIARYPVIEARLHESRRHCRTPLVADLRIAVADRVMQRKNARTRG